MKKLGITIILISFAIFSFCQNPEKGHVFQDDIVPRIDIEIANVDLEYLLANENLYKDDYKHANFIFNNGTTRDTILDIGFRLRGNTSRGSQKKSFKVSFNTFEKGRKYHGLEKLNLNGEHNDPSIVRSKFCFDLADKMGITASRANHVKLYINNQYYGLYINVEHIDEEFLKSRYGSDDGNLYKCLYPADLDYLGEDSNDYKIDAYELKTNEAEDDYQDLADFIRILNLTNQSEFRCELESVFNVDDYIKVMAFDILTANWDGYIFNNNNYYLYHNPSTDKFEFIIYDVDNSLGIDWFQINWSSRNIFFWENDNGVRPLYTRIMKDPVYKSRFSQYMKSILSDVFIPEELSEYLNEKKNLIFGAIQSDTYRTLDYGFTINDFDKSYDEALDYFHVPIGITEYIEKRHISASNQLIGSNSIPHVNTANIVLNNDNTAFQFQVNFKYNNNPDELYITYDNGPIIDQNVSLNDLGINGDNNVDDNIYSSDWINISGDVLITYRTIFTDKQQQYQYPTCSSNLYTLPNQNPTLVINEFMASNSNTIKDEYGEYDDWIELYNNGNDSIFLGDLFLTDNKGKPEKWTMPDTWIGPNEYLILWADGDIDQGETHCSFKLSASGEHLAIYANENNVLSMVDEYEFGAQSSDISTGRFPNGIGQFQALNPTPGSTNELYNAIETTNQLDINIAPNPSNGYIYLSQKNQLLDGSNLKIIDITGKTISFTHQSDINGIHIWLKEAANGIYFIQNIDKKRLSVQKFVIIK